jgi:hypothetical protein
MPYVEVYYDYADALRECSNKELRGEMERRLLGVPEETELRQTRLMQIIDEIEDAFGDNDRMHHNISLMRLRALLWPVEGPKELPARVDA